MNARTCSWSRWLALVALVGLGPACAGARGVDLTTVYDRTDRDFDSAILFRPDDLDEGAPHWTHAPLLVVQNGKPGDAPPVVTYETTRQGWIYRWWGADGARAQGLSVTIGEDGFPIAYEALRDSSGARVLFVQDPLEQASRQAHGPSPPGRRFSIERDLDSAPRVAVGGLFEPGPIPLGPFVYLWEETGDVNVVLCRCMPSRVLDIVDSVAYRLIPHDAAAAPVELKAPPPLEKALRLPSAESGDGRDETVQ